MTSSPSKTLPCATPVTLDELLQAAVGYQQAGQLREAERLYREILKAQPQHPDANHNLGRMAVELGLPDRALPFLKEALKTKPDHDPYWSSYLETLLVLGKVDAAQSVLKECEQAGLPAAEALAARLDEWLRARPPKPGSSAVHPSPGLNRQQRRAAKTKSNSAQQSSGAKRAANVRDLISVALKQHQEGRLDDAEKTCQQILLADGQCADAFHLQGIVALQKGDVDLAVKLFKRAIDINNKFAPFHFNLGNAIKAQGRLQDAIVCYEKASAIEPTNTNILNNLGLAYKDLGGFDKAVACFKKALAVDPGFAMALNNLGAVLQTQGCLEQAIDCFERAVLVKQDYVEAIINLGNCYKEQGKTSRAVACFEQAFALRPSYLEGLSSLAFAHQCLGNLDIAEACFRTARSLDRDSLELAFNAELLLPIIPPSNASITDWRRRYASGIEKLMLLPGVINNPEKIWIFSFYLAYHNADDRELLEAQCRLLRSKARSLSYTAPHILNWQAPKSGVRIRVGFLSQVLVGHTIGKLYQGFIRHLDRSLFEVVLIHSSASKHDTFSVELDQLADKAVILHGDLAAQQKAVALEELDVLFFPDVGMLPETYLLAYARLAPVQAVSWGHPNTTGIDTLDYFISAEPIEPPEADVYYSERLIQLRRLPTYYQPLAVPTMIPPRAELGLPEAGTLYGCPQSLFKIHPDFDFVLSEIAVGDPEGHIVLLDGKDVAWRELLRKRWAENCPILLERVLFLPRQTLERFMALLAHFDVLLDPIHFGSGNTLYEAAVYGTPIVTWPGSYMRGRIVAGAYRQMGIVDPPIAESISDYAPLALALGRDPKRREALRNAAMSQAAELFADNRAVREFESFLKAAVDAAGHGEKIPGTWQPEDLKGI